MGSRIPQKEKTPNENKNEYFTPKDNFRLGDRNRGRICDGIQRESRRS